MIIALYNQLKQLGKIKAWKNSVLNGIRTYYHCDTGAVLYQLSYQSWDLAALLVGNIPVDGEECKWIYERPYIWTAEKDTKT